MAKARSIPRERKGPSFTDRMVVYVSRGVLTIQKWPRKRGTPTHPTTLWWNDWFRQANFLAKYADAMSMARAIEMTKGTPLYPRDVILSAMRGRLYSWADDTGWRWYSVAAIGDISESLDVLAQTVGSVLVRATDRWRAPPAGNVADVLTHMGVGNSPEWQPPAGGGGSLASTSIDRSSANAGAQATQGWSFVPPLNLTVHAALPHLNQVAGGTYQASLCTLAAGLIASVVGRTAVFAAPGAGTRSVYMPFTPPLVAALGVPHAIFVTRTDATAATNSGAYRQGSYPLPLPQTSEPLGRSVVSVLPVVGQAYANVAGVLWTVNLLYSI